MALSEKRKKKRRGGVGTAHLLSIRMRGLKTDTSREDFSAWQHTSVSLRSRKAMFVLHGPRCCRREMSGSGNRSSQALDSMRPSQVNQV